MHLGSPSIRYAKALMEYALERNTENILYEEFSILAYILKTNRDLREVLENPLISKDKKLKLICVAVAGNNSPSEDFIRSMNLVLNQKREPYLLSISLMYLDLYRQYKNIVLVKVITAISIGTEIVEKIRTQLIKELETQIMMEQIVDPSIQGGFILDLNNNYRFDASVSTQLKKIRKQLIESDAKIV